MRAPIIVRHASTNTIAQRFDTSVDEATVNKVVEMLRNRYDEESYVIDMSQVQMARDAMRSAAA